LRQLEHVLTFEKLLKARTIGKFEIMSNLNLFVAGSIQGSEQFSDIARADHNILL
jgi:hypothetical protein